MFPWLLTQISSILSTKISINKLNVYKNKTELNQNSNISTNENDKSA